MTRRFGVTAALVGLGLLLETFAPRIARCDSPPATDTDAAAIKNAVRAATLRSTVERGRLRRQAAASERQAPRRDLESAPTTPPGVSPELRRRVERWRSEAALKSNVRANDPSGDTSTDPVSGLPDATQSEVSIAASGNRVLVAWNDGEGFVRPAPNNDITGYGYSTDGGATFTDGGAPPKLTNWTWSSEPVVTVNERTGTFYLCGLVDSTAAYNGVAVVPATFSGPGIVWGTPVMIRKEAWASIFLEKEWLVADSSNGRLYAIYSRNSPVTGFNNIAFQTSANGTSWTAPVIVSSPLDSGYVSGPRVAVGPTGEVYAIWAAIGFAFQDFFKIRKSLDLGTTFAPEVSLPGYYGNYGSGAPGFSGEKGITLPSIAVDRTTGPDRGRAYVAWNECINFYDDLPGGAGEVSEPPGEVNVNDFFEGATAFTVGNTLRGVVGTGDFDCWKFDAVQGETGVFNADSLDAGLDIAFRLFCSDTTTRLALSDLGIGLGGIIVYTFPATGTYYLRAAGFNGSSGGYRIRSKFSAPGPERARDQRDVFVSSSTDATSWSTPVRVNDDPGTYDNWLPEVAVSSQGRVYCTWYDWRDSAPGTCGGQSNIYMSRSDNAGASWVSLGAIGDTTTAWSAVRSNMSPNQGGYIGLFANDIGVYPAWADGRSGDPDVWTVALPLQLTPTQISLVSAEALADRVRLTWYAQGTAGLLAEIERRGDGGDWSAIGSRAVPGNGRLSFEDGAVTPGARYGYRLGITENGIERFYGETWVTVPAFGFSLGGAEPNPTERDLWISFSLGGRAPATVSLIDVGGRVVRTRDVGGTPGPGRVNLGAGGRLPAGVYVVRLTQAGRSLTTRVSVIR